MLEFLAGTGAGILIALLLGHLERRRVSRRWVEETEREGRWESLVGSWLDNITRAEIALRIRQSFLEHLAAHDAGGVRAGGAQCGGC